MMKLKQAIAHFIAIAMAMTLCVSYTSAITISNNEGLILADAVSSEHEGSVFQTSKSKAIIVVPGILGTCLYDFVGKETLWFNLFTFDKTALYLNEDGTPKSTSIIPHPSYKYGTTNTYKELIESLQNAFEDEFDVIFFGYDWRLSNVDAAAELAKVANNYSKVVFVAHSMGGLVVSKYLANSASNRNKTLGMITVGTPYVGSAKCINAMETGELIKIPDTDTSLYRNLVKEICQNSLASFQLLPTSKYNTYTGFAPISVGGSLYSSITPQLYNTAWGKASDGNIKVQFSAATSFHNSLYNGSGDIVINWSTVNSYTIAGNGIDTISRVEFTSDYKIKGLKYSNSGDGTVLLDSAGFGTPDMTYSSSGDDCEHSKLVKKPEVRNQIVSTIASMTGVAPATAIGNSFHAMASEKIEVNPRGWLMDTDNKRINVYTESEAQLYIDGFLIDESGDALYDSNGLRIGSVWPLGNTGRKMYALFNNNYDIQTVGEVTIEYMNNGYYDKIEEYSAGENMVRFSIGDYSSMNIEAIESRIYSNISRDSNLIQPTHVYSEAELLKLNQD